MTKSEVVYTHLLTTQHIEAKAMSRLRQILIPLPGETHGWQFFLTINIFSTVVAFFILWYYNVGHLPVSFGHNMYYSNFGSIVLSLWLLSKITQYGGKFEGTLSTVFLIVMWLVFVPGELLEVDGLRIGPLATLLFILLGVFAVCIAITLAVLTLIGLINMILPKPKE
jgi:hypothetical protein